MPSIREHPYSKYLRLFFGWFAFYFVWIACALGAARGYPLIGPLLVLASILFHLLLSPQRAKDLAIIAFVSAVGFCIDTTYGLLGMLTYASVWEAVPWLCPLWLVGMYALFGMTVDHSLGWLQKNLFAAAVLGALGGAASYAAGARMGAVQFLWPWWDVMKVLAGVWFVFCPLVCYVSRRIHRFFA
jgi:hypothetical protein